jgi:hypothetical protein
MSLDDFRALFVQKLVTAIGTKEFDLLVTKFLRVAIELSFALRAGHPENFRHVCLSLLHHRDAEVAEIGVFLDQERYTLRPQRLRGEYSDSLSATDLAIPSADGRLPRAG